MITEIDFKVTGEERKKQNVRYSTKVGYKYVLNILRKEQFAKRNIRDIKVSDVQLWMIKLTNDGRGYIVH